MVLPKRRGAKPVEVPASVVRVLADVLDECTVEIEMPDSSGTAIQCDALTVTHEPTVGATATYAWSVAKSADVTSVDLTTGQTSSVGYQVVVGASATTETMVTDPITVHNGGAGPATINGVGDLNAQIGALNVTCASALPLTLAPGDDLECTASLAAPDTDARTFKAAVLREAVAHHPEAANVVLGSALTVSSASSTVAGGGTIDGCADVTDTLQGAFGALCVGADTLPKTYSYARTVGPFATTGTRTIANTATATARDTATATSSTWTVTVNVTAPAADGCTRTVGYWKTHAGGKKQPDAVTRLLPIWLGTPSGAASVQVTTARQASTILEQATASNGIQKLQAQLLAAKLNIASGAASSSVLSTITAADNFLATHAATVWASLTRSTQSSVNRWATTLDSYNKGLMVPGSCPG